MEKRKDTGNQPAANSAAVGTPTKPTEGAPAADPPSSRRRGGQKRKASGGSGGGNSSTPSTSSLSKRQAREKPTAVPHTSIHNGPCTRARQSPSTVVSSATSFLDAVKNEVEAMAALEPHGGAGKGTEELSVAEEDSAALETKFEAEFEAIRSRDANVHVVPIPAGWFSWMRVHPLEERTLPSFFNGKSESRTPEIYMEIRNWIMRKFHENPSKQIELKDLSELSVGELEAKQEVMDFLDHWGLINYHPFPESNTTVAKDEDDGTGNKDALVEKLYHFETEQPCAPVIPKTNVTTPTVPSGLFPDSSIAEELIRSEGVEYHCNSCSADCSRKRYHCQKQADFDLCTECFNNGKFDSDMSPADFILMEPAEAAGASGGKWTDQETLLLLEALELYKENWNEIAEHVATKTKAQCILHFVQMPIEDTFMDCVDEVDIGSKETADPTSADNDPSAPKGTSETIKSKSGMDETQPAASPKETSKQEDPVKLKDGQENSENCAVKALKEAFEAVGSSPVPGGQFSFAEAGNPVMALAAFLVRLVEPNVVTALVHSSLKSLSGNSSSIELSARHSLVLEDPPLDMKKSTDSERPVIELAGQDSQKNEKMNEEKFDSALDAGDLPNNQNGEIDKDSVQDKKELSGSPDRPAEKSSPVNENQPVLPSNGSDNSDLLKNVVMEDAKESDDLTPKPETYPSSAKDPGDRTDEGMPDKTENPQDTAAEYAKVSDDLAAREEIPSGSPDTCNRAPREVPSQNSEDVSNAAVVPDSLPSEEKEPEQMIASNTTAENQRTTDEEDGKDSNSEQQDLSKTKDDLNIDKIKRAACTALSAAAVKAKLLADQEEEQIQQLATLLIEKQLHKLETKLAFFSEMESVVMRVREQIERTKQRLYQERAQIIAARLGYPGQSSRPMQQSLPVNRVAMGFANSVVRPQMNMNSLRPPMSRSMMSMAPTSNTLAPTAAGNPVRPTNPG
ncbi:hypothetical protein NMG60_11019591 [Bertholletia excelsa]